LKRAVAELTSRIETAFPGLPNARWVALRLLDGDEHIIQAIRKGELGELSSGGSTELASIEATRVEGVR
jgi:ferrous iron transport protein B